MSNIIAELEREQMSREVPEFGPGDTLTVKVRVKGGKSRAAAPRRCVHRTTQPWSEFAFTVRKISHGEGVERVFQTYSPAIDEITVKRRGDVRRAKLYYLRGRTGNAARIKEKLGKR